MYKTARILMAAALIAGGTAWAADAPVFSLAWSEYPSWSAFGVADEIGLIDGDEGKLGPIEEKWGVDIVLKEAEYEPCLAMYAAGQTDAVCITNMDILNPAISRPGVAVLPTSTSFGADACLVTGGITDVKQLKDVETRGLSLSVSEYCFVRNLELLGEDPKDYKFRNMDPGAAALAMQQKQNGFDSIVVWNPFVLDTLNKRKDVRVIFDSTTIPNEIVDMVVVAKESLDKPKGKDFARAVAETYYELNRQLADPAKRDDLLIALGEKFSDLDLQSMRKVVKQTKFYATPEEAVALFTGADLKETMKKVSAFCVSYGIVEGTPVIEYGAGTSAGHLVFDPAIIQACAAGK